MNISPGHIEIFVKDPIKSKDFYIDVLGFELEEIQGENIVWLKLKNLPVLLRRGKNSHPAETYQKANIAMVIYTDNLTGTLDTYISRGLEIKGDDTGCPVFTDPDGNWFQLVNPIEHR